MPNHNDPVETDDLIALRLRSEMRPTDIRESFGKHRMLIRTLDFWTPSDEMMI